MKAISPPWHPVYFGELLSEDEKSLAKKMRKLGISFAYAPIYGQGSMAVHGSSFEQGLLLSDKDPDVVPRFIGSPHEIRSGVDNIVIWTQRVLVRLSLLLKHLSDRASNEHF